MEQGFERTAVSFLDTVLEEIQNTEQTQEIRIPEGMPDVGKILASWGQVILRSKEWQEDTVSCSGGLMIWVMYAPEDGGREVSLESWIPFQMRWDIPEDLPEGKIHLGLLTRFVDARSVSPRKIMVRAGVAGHVQVLCPGEAEVYRSTGSMPGIQLLNRTYPVRMNREAGEKTVSMEEVLSVPDSVSVPQELLYYRLEPKMTEKKLLSGKLVFRGKGLLHLIYRGEEGQIHSWDFEIPFSQIIQLEGEYGPEAQAELCLVGVDLGLTLDEEGQLHIKGTLTGQYVISDRMLLEVTEDAYCPGRALELEKKPLQLPVILQQRRENLYGEQTIPGNANLMMDVSFLPDYPRQRWQDGELELEIPGALQVLYYGEDGMLHGANAKWTGHLQLPSDQQTVMTALPQSGQVNTVTGNGHITVKMELPVDLTAAARQNIEMVTSVQAGEQVVPDPNRPTLILRRAGEEGLWDLAKKNGTTMEVIRRINRLSGEPAPGQLLLIPIP